ncbi:MAG: aminoglycoside phosphotransferase family protein [Terriglobales bacterium]
MELELDIENFDALRYYLGVRGFVKLGETISLEKLAGGVSNRTVKLAWADGHGWVLKQALSKLRVNVDWFSSPERIAVEARALRWLNRSAPSGATPAFVFEDMENHLLGMEAIPAGHENWKSLLLAGKILSDHFEQVGLLLGTIHRRSSTCRGEVVSEFADTTYFESLRLEPYYLYTAQNITAAAEFLNALARETLQHKDSLVHGDFSPKNTLIYQGKLILLDYEVVHFGDPAFDVGFALTHFLSKAHHLPRVRDRLASAAELFWQAYYDEVMQIDWAKVVEPRVVRHTLACLLARVAGKSPLEYLTPWERARQHNVVLSLMREPPHSVPDLIADFIRKIETYAEN